MNQQGGRVLLVSNRKGGTGKTATVVNLSAELAKRGFKVLVADLDTQANATLGLGFEPFKISATLHQFLFGDLNHLNDALLKTRWENLYLLPADPLLEEHHRFLDPERVKTAIKECSTSFDFILIDSAPSLDNLLIGALRSAHWVLIPFLPHYLSLEGIKSLIRIFFRVAVRDNPELRLAGLLPVMFNPRVNQHRWVLEEVIRNFGKNRVLSPIRTDIKVSEAFQAKTPLLHYAPHSKVVEDYRNLAEDLLLIINSQNLLHH